MKALLLALAAAAPQPQHFDLVCTGTPQADGALVWEGVDLKLRIDLDARKWCEGDCKVINDVADVQPAVLWLEKESTIEEARGLVHFRIVDRETGEYTRVRESREFARIAQKASCNRAPFSGFPKLESKF
jgi:hypothetical protein